MPLSDLPWTTCSFRRSSWVKRDLFSFILRLTGKALPLSVERATVPPLLVTPFSSKIPNMQYNFKNVTLCMHGTWVWNAFDLWRKVGQAFEIFKKIHRDYSAQFGQTSNLGKPYTNILIKTPYLLEQSQLFFLLTSTIFDGWACSHFFACLTCHIHGSFPSQPQSYRECTLTRLMRPSFFLSLSLIHIWRCRRRG